ncbi:MAG: DUF2061 domain-containing protein [Nitrospiria bacterium]
MVSYKNGKNTRETHLRSILKGVSWRILATSTTIIIAYVITGNTATAIEIGGIEVFAKFILYYLHERGWQALPRGTIRELKTEILNKGKGHLE